MKAANKHQSLSHRLDSLDPVLELLRPQNFRPKQRIERLPRQLQRFFRVALRVPEFAHFEEHVSQGSIVLDMWSGVEKLLLASRELPQCAHDGLLGGKLAWRVSPQVFRELLESSPYA